MGGENYFKGVSLERTATLSPNRLKQAQEMFTNLNEYRDKINYDSTENRSKVEQWLKDC